MRSLGLDLVRSSAIWLVLITHGSTYFFMQHYKHITGFSYVTGYTAVEIFFVLSGFLIGRILLTTVYEQKTWSSLFHFYIRRWLRTLPLYYLIVTVFVLCLGKKLYWQNLVFLQNFSAQHLGFMPVSWSLSLEEWFYLIVPLFFVVIARVSSVHNKKKVFFLACGFVILLELLIRIVYVSVHNPSWDFGVRKQIFLRLDSLMVGVLLAGCKLYAQQFYLWISTSRLLWIGTAIALFILEKYDVYRPVESGTIDHSFFCRTVLFTLISFICAVYVAVLETNVLINSTLAKLKKPASQIKFYSMMTYAIYLVHFDIFNFYSHRIDHPKLVTSWGLALSALIASVSMAFVLHKCFEKPIMDLRDRIPIFLRTDRQRRNLN